MSTVTLEFDSSTVTLEFDSSTVTLEQAGGTILSSPIAAALNAADDPSAANPFATLADVTAVRYARIFMMGG